MESAPVADYSSINEILNCGNFEYILQNPVDPTLSSCISENFGVSKECNTNKSHVKVADVEINFMDAARCPFIIEATDEKAGNKEEISVNLSDFCPWNSNNLVTENVEISSWATVSPSKSTPSKVTSIPQEDTIDKVDDEIRKQLRKSPHLIKLAPCKVTLDKINVPVDMQSLSMMTTKDKHFCEVCSETFASQELLACHRRTTHDKDEIFHCKQCALFFEDKHSVYLHIKARHNGEPESSDELESSGEPVSKVRLEAPNLPNEKLPADINRNSLAKDKKLFVCTFCKEERIFKYQGFLNKHIKQNHSEAGKNPAKKRLNLSKIIQCPGCNEQFNDNFVLKAHMQKFKCGLVEQKKQLMKARMDSIIASISDEQKPEKVEELKLAMKNETKEEDSNKSQPTPEIKVKKEEEKDELSIVFEKKNEPKIISIPAVHVTLGTMLLPGSNIPANVIFPYRSAMPGLIEPSRQRIAINSASQLPFAIRSVLKKSQCTSVAPRSLSQDRTKEIKDNEVQVLGGRLTPRFVMQKGEIIVKKIVAKSLPSIPPKVKILDQSFEMPTQKKSFCFICPICNGNFSSPTTLRKHKIDVHGVDCSICKKRFARDGIAHHSCRKRDIFKCIVCQCILHCSVYDLSKHMEIEHKVRIINCVPGNPPTWDLKRIEENPIGSPDVMKNEVAAPDSVSEVPEESNVDVAADAKEANENGVYAESEEDFVNIVTVEVGDNIVEAVSVEDEEYKDISSAKTDDSHIDGEVLEVVRRLEEGVEKCFDCPGNSSDSKNLHEKKAVVEEKLETSSIFEDDKEKIEDVDKNNLPDDIPLETKLIVPTEKESQNIITEESKSTETIESLPTLNVAQAEEVQIEEQKKGEISVADVDKAIPTKDTAGPATAANKTRRKNKRKLFYKKKIAPSHVYYTCKICSFKSHANLNLKMHIMKKHRGLQTSKEEPHIELQKPQEEPHIELQKPIEVLEKTLNEEPVKTTKPKEVQILATALKRKRFMSKKIIANRKLGGEKLVSNILLGCDKIYEFQCTQCLVFFSSQGELQKHQISHEPATKMVLARRKSDSMVEDAVPRKKSKSAETGKRSDKKLEMEFSLVDEILSEAIPSSETQTDVDKTGALELACHECSFTCSLPQELELHKNDVHGIVKSCIEVLDTKLLVEIEGSRTRTKEYHCETCGELYPHVKNFTQHISTHLNNPLFYQQAFDFERVVCTLCKTEVASFLLLSHLIRNHSKVTKKREEPRLRCEKCNIRLWSVASYFMHLRRRHNERLVHCDICYLVFKDLPFLQQHARDQHAVDMDEYQEEYPRLPALHCDLCPKVFCSKTRLDAHQANTHDCLIFLPTTNPNAKVQGSEIKLRNNFFVCNHCNETFFDRAKFESHILAQESLEQKFSTPRFLYTCPFCSEAFPTERAAVDHLAWQHTQPLENQPEMPELEVPCRKCKAELPSSKDLFNHLQQAHQETVMDCVFCLAAFGSLPGLKEHYYNNHALKEVHKIKRVNLEEIIPEKKAKVESDPDQKLAMTTTVRLARIPQMDKQVSWKLPNNANETNLAGILSKQLRAQEKPLNTVQVKKSSRPRLKKRPKLEDRPKLFFCTKLGDFQCNTCKFRVANRHTMMYHALNNHEKKPKVEKSRPLTPSPKLPPVKHTCELCLKEFDSRWSLKKHSYHEHIKLTVNTGKKFVCPFCEKAFNVKRGLDMHLRLSRNCPLITETTKKASDVHEENTTDDSLNIKDTSEPDVYMKKEEVEIPEIKSEFDLPVESGALPVGQTLFEVSLFNIGESDEEEETSHLVPEPHRAKDRIIFCINCQCDMHVAAYSSHMNDCYKIKNVDGCPLCDAPINNGKLVSHIARHMDRTSSTESVRCDICSLLLYNDCNYLHHSLLVHM